MPTHYSQQATVRVWRNVKTLGNVPTSHIGHAAVTITGSAVPGNRKHISFWPKHGFSMGVGAVRAQSSDFTETPLDDKISEALWLTRLRLEVGYCLQNGLDYPDEYDHELAKANKDPLWKPRPGQKRLGRDSGNWPLWSQSPETKVVLPGIGPRSEYAAVQDISWGLSVRRMGLWWQNFLLTNPHYQALGVQNCAGVALMALREGGSEAFVKCPGIRVYGEPVQVERYAKELATQLERMEDWTRQFDADARQAILSGLWKPSDNLSHGLWTMEMWKKQSALGTFKIRSATIRDIDQALEAYHTLDWKNQFAERYATLVTLFLAVVKHRQDKADSGRSEAVLRLGAQILAVMRSPGPIW